MEAYASTLGLLTHLSAISKCSCIPSEAWPWVQTEVQRSNWFYKHLLICNDDNGLKTEKPFNPTFRNFLWYARYVIHSQFRVIGLISSPKNRRPLHTKMLNEIFYKRRKKSTSYFFVPYVDWGEVGVELRRHVA